MFRFDKQAAPPGFVTPLSYGKMRRPGTVPEVLMDCRFLCRTRSTSVIKFERVHVPSSFSETEEHTPQYMHLCRNELSTRDPKISFTFHVDNRRGDHQDPRCAVNAARFCVSAEVDAAANHTWDDNNPTPTILWDNLERQVKFKTELWKYYFDGWECPWYVICNFVLGEHELQFCYSTLLLMESSEEIAKAYNYLCRPCLKSVCTGAW